MGQEKLGVTDESVIKAVGLYGGGIAATGHTCGAVLGAVAALSSMYSRGNLVEKENPAMWDVGGKIVRRFEGLTGQYGGIRCLDIARVNWKDPQAVKEFFTNPDSRLKICIQLVGETAQALGELIESEAAKQTS